MVIKLSYENDETLQGGTITITEVEENTTNVKIEFDPPLTDTTPDPYGVLSAFCEILNTFGPPRISDEVLERE